ncbi:MAG: Phosphoglucosamine mutase [uncultured Nocardioidaceae bacterium]|uniref:Phosphoglucosamine mutase n=1 Tax=uncultured Nocardioidaceae bacterium TaxID=253824 RepID=A0A6J4MVQ2_9ACTN|nr:MAG: Phosphoglucosamine mutase [uncultured Nocardioidaceae bacterium]
MSRLFGTDGVRGVANGDLTAQLALDLSVAAAEVLGHRGARVTDVDRRPVALVGRDPRASGEFLEAIVVGALGSAGVDVRRLGVLPTPGVAHLTAATGADFGVMLSASHNPMPDNGIKFFARGGRKLDDVVEDAIEAAIGQPWRRPTGARVGRVVDDPEAVRSYVDHLVSTVATPPDGVRVVLDCAEGAAHQSAPAAFTAAGADVVAIHDQPDGLNINVACGSTHLASLQRAVLDNGAAAGFAFDGDADRCLAVDAAGQVVDGDQLLAILALALRDAGGLAHDTVVATVMSNLGFVQALRDAGVTVVRAKVGDRYVLEEMSAGGFSLGGEQSGHVVMSEYATTGDGVLAALHVAARMAQTGQPLAALAAVMRRLPQTLVNVGDVDKTRTYDDPAVTAAVADAEAELGESGRVLLRPSGTEPLVRVMVEAASSQQAERVAERLAGVVRSSLAL